MVSWALKSASHEAKGAPPQSCQARLPLAVGLARPPDRDQAAFVAPRGITKKPVAVALEVMAMHHKVVYRRRHRSEYMKVYTYTPNHITSRPIHTLHSITVHDILSHYNTLHYITLHYITLHYITLHYIAWHYAMLHYTTLRYATLCYATLHCITLHYVALHCNTKHYIT